MSVVATETDSDSNASDKQGPAVPKKVYLDQSDWSYLCDGKFPEAEVVLRRLGTQQRAVFFVSFEHFLEVGGLMTGFDNRLRFMCDFPSTVWLNRSASDIIRRDVLSIITVVDGTLFDPLDIDARLLSEQEPADIKRAVLACSLLLRPIFWAMARAERTGRKPMIGQTAEDRRAHERGMAAFMSGDTANWAKYVEQASKKAHPIMRLAWHILAPVYRQMFSIIHPAIANVASRLVDRGLLAPPGKRVDPIYTNCVLPNLPKGFASTPSQRKLSKLWRDKDQRCQIAPCLACVAAIDEAIYNDSSYKYKPSDVVDRLHAAFAPLVDVFTCDKRSAPPLEAVLRKSGRHTVVIRSGHLADVAATLAAAVG